MVVVEHCLGKGRVKKEVDTWLKLALLNQIGGYFIFPVNGNDSVYDGLFVYDHSEEEMYKVVDSIDIKDFNANSVVNNFSDFDIIDNKNDKVKNKISFFVPYHYDSLVIHGDKENSFTVNLDVKKSYDSREWGRYYEFVEEKDSKVVIKFTKKSDKKEDKTHGMKEFTYFIVVSTDGKIRKLNEWKKRFYDFDRKRNDPCERFVYSAVSLEGKNIVISVSKRQDVAVNDNDYVSKNISKLETLQRQELSDLMKIKTSTKDKNIDFAYKCAMHNLNKLALDKGIFAGLPWFYQFWTRDEAISLKALSFYSSQKAKKILLKQIEKILPDGRITNIRSGNYLDSPVGSADGIGWCVKRLSSTKLDKIEQVFVSAKLDYSIKKLMELHTKDDLEINEQKETWMDTNPENKDPRDGARIEMQALRLNMYKYLYSISNNKKYLELEEELRKKTREKFWDGTVLADGINDKTIRPNIFIAAYVYPELLAKEEWKKCFQNSLPKLWCDWGGLTTIDKSDQRFVGHYTGKDNLSYQRGDSWFWINNLTALVLHRTDKEFFENYIKQIMKASAYEILFSGVIGAHAELSSAAQLSSEACLMQAWSMAMFIELINEIFG